MGDWVILDFRCVWYGKLGRERLGTWWEIIRAGYLQEVLYGAKCKMNSRLQLDYLLSWELRKEMSVKQTLFV